MAVELAEFDDVTACLVEARRRGSTEVRHLVTDHRTGRGGCPWRLRADSFSTHRRLTAQVGGRVLRGRACGGTGPGSRHGRAVPGLPGGRLVPRLIRAGHVHPSSDRATRPRSRWASAADGLLAEFRPLAGSLSAVSLGLAGQRGVGVVDLGHPSRRRTRCRRVVAGQVRMVGPGQASPGGLDERGRRTTGDTQDVVRISFGHGPSVARGTDHA